MSKAAEANTPADDPRWRGRLLDSFFEFLSAHGLTVEQLTYSKQPVGLSSLFNDFLAERYRPGSTTFALDNVMAVHAVVAGAAPLVMALYSGWEASSSGAGQRKEAPGPPLPPRSAAGGRQAPPGY